MGNDRRRDDSGRTDRRSPTYLMTRRSTVDTARIEKNGLQREFDASSRELERIRVDRARVQRLLEEMEREKSALIEIVETLEERCKNLEYDAERMEAVESDIRKATEDAIKLGRKLCVEAEYGS
ncbi:hypothetical protein QR680_009566 [Steinernema hermaphroditum]|uniref:Uncharacterized protein n=2 Tax=Steinernema hermaphroditum TaxID=289476 RepID=A0AA39IM37_9BILA|nr:hypothetical protein QR680_009566 [Steinernema hermaphroditum]